MIILVCSILGFSTLGCILAVLACVCFASKKKSSENNNDLSVASLNTSNANIGWLSGLCLGLVIPVKFYTCILCFPSVIFLLLCWNMPESPM